MRQLIILLLVQCVFNSKAQTITTVAGNGTQGYSGDGGTATSAQIYQPTYAVSDNSGNIYFSDWGNNRIRKVNTSGIISTIAGTGVAGFSGDWNSATSAQLNGPWGIAVDLSGNIYFADINNNRVRKINTSGIITTIAGNGVPGFSGDSGIATYAQLYLPNGIACDAAGNIYIADESNYRIRKVNTSGIITTIAGTGVGGYSGDGGPATAAQIFVAPGVAVDGSGNVYIADAGNNRIRKVNTSGVISTVAGNGVSGYSGDGAVATSAEIAGPFSVAIDAFGNIFMADQYNARIRKVNTYGIITTIAGTGVAGYSGDGGPATLAQLHNPEGVSIDASNNLLIADRSNSRIRKVSLTTGIKEFSSFSSINIRPNPNSGSFKLQVDMEISEGEMLLFNSLGQKVHEQKIIQGENNITTNNLSKGLYHYSLMQNKQLIQQGKMVVE